MRSSGVDGVETGEIERLEDVELDTKELYDAWLDVGDKEDWSTCKCLW